MKAILTTYLIRDSFSRLAGGLAKNYKGGATYKQQSRFRDNFFNASLLSTNPFQRGSRIIEIGKVFATSFSVHGGPSFPAPALVVKIPGAMAFSETQTTLSREDR